MSKALFKKKHYLVIKNAIDPKVAEFVYNYFLMKRQVTQTFLILNIFHRIVKNMEHGKMNRYQTHIHIIVT